MSSQRLSCNPSPHLTLICFVSNCFIGSRFNFLSAPTLLHSILCTSLVPSRSRFLLPLFLPPKRIPWSQRPALRRIVVARGLSVLLADVPSFIQASFAHRSAFVASHRCPMPAYGLLCLRQPKGLRDRNSPICTLSHHGYGAVHITRTGCRWLPLTFFLISPWR